MHENTNCYFPKYEKIACSLLVCNKTKVLGIDFNFCEIQTYSLLIL